jgi:DNA polymerase-3 subunit delta'
MIIWMPEKMNDQAQNKLLKTLEEPLAKTIVILVSSKVEELLPTIVSRTQTVKCRPLRSDEIFEALSRLETVDGNTATDISKRANGNFNKALQIIANPSGESAYFELFRDWMRTCVSPKNNDLLKVTEQISTLSRDEQTYFIDYCLQFLQDAISFAYLGKEKASYTGEAVEFAEKFAPYIVGKDLGAFHDVLSRGQMLVERNVNPKLLYMKLSAEMIRIFKNQRPEVIS